MTRLRVFAVYAAYFVFFAVFFVIMAVLFIICAMGIPLGLMMAFFGFVMIAFKADFVVTELAPPVMLFGGISCAAVAAALGLIALKIGFFVCRMFRRTKLHCDKIRGWR